MKKKIFKIASLVISFTVILISDSSARTRPVRAKLKASRVISANFKMSREALAELKVKNIQFGFNKPSFSVAYQSELKKIVKLMAANSAAIKLGGHADNKGTYLYNWKLSKKRVDEVKAYMVNNGADSSRIAATEYGDTKPIASNKTIIGRQKNRRVEIHFVN